MIVTYDLTGDIQQLPPVAPPPREPAVSAPASTSSTSDQQQQRRQDQARQSALPLLNFQNALAAQEANSGLPEEAPVQPRPEGIAAYEQVARRSSTATNVSEQTAAAAQPLALGPVAPQAFVAAASAYTDRLLAVSDFARPGESVRLQA